MTTTTLPRVGRALQINMHPFDAPHVLHTLPHQLRIWSGQVDRTIVTLDTRLARAGRYHADAFDTALANIIAILEDARRTHANLIIDQVAYDDATRSPVGAAFFASSTHWPDRAFDGGPFYVYFHGLLRANADRVVHIDSDMLFGGGSQSWMDEAETMLADYPDALCVGPLPGPPRPGGAIDESLHREFPGSRQFPGPHRLDAPSPAYSFSTVSTRIFMMDMNRFASRVGALELVRPDLRRRVRAALFGESGLSMPAEEVLSANMIANGLTRIDFLGQEPGLFSLHPPFRSPEFYARLPGLIERIENGEIPDGQRGDYDINGAMMDWTSARHAKRRSARYRKAFSQLIAVQRDRLTRRREPVSPSPR